MFTMDNDRSKASRKEEEFTFLGQLLLLDSNRIFLIPFNLSEEYLIIQNMKRYKSFYLRVKL